MSSTTVVKKGTAMVILPVSISRMPLLKSCSALAATESSTWVRVRARVGLGSAEVRVVARARARAKVRVRVRALYRQPRVALVLGHRLGNPVVARLLVLCALLLSHTPTVHTHGGSSSVG
jgi:hypothetical protein